MAYSYFDYEGTDTTIQTDILCVSTEHMYAFKVLSEDDSNVTLSDVALAATFTKNNAGVLCELDTAPSTKIRVIRSTPYDVLMHDFNNGAQFNADSVDEVYEQLLYLCQELVEGKLIMDSSGNFSNSTGSLADAATKTDVSNAVAAVKNEILGGTRAAFDTLKELADALGNDANFANTITRELAKKADISDLGDAIKQQMAAAMQHQASTNGYTKLPNDLIDQWGEVLMSWQGEGPVKVTFPIAFPNACYNVQITAKSSGRSGFVGTDLTIGVGEITATGFSAMLNTWAQGVSVNEFLGFLWRAIGK